MANSRRPRSNKSPETSAEALDELNARVRSRPNFADKIRQAVEAQIEAKTRKRRRREDRASAGWKK